MCCFSSLHAFSLVTVEQMSEQVRLTMKRKCLAFTFALGKTIYEYLRPFYHHFAQNIGNKGGFQLCYLFKGFMWKCFIHNECLYVFLNFFFHLFCCRTLHFSVTLENYTGIIQAEKRRYSVSLYYQQSTSSSNLTITSGHCILIN